MCSWDMREVTFTLHSNLIYCLILPFLILHLAVLIQQSPALFLLYDFVPLKQKQNPPDHQAPSTRLSPTTLSRPSAARWRGSHWRGSLCPVSLDGVRFEFLGSNPSGAQDSPGHLDYVGSVSGQRGLLMGIGQWVSENQRPRLDPLLRWQVPDHWTARDAATVPYVYASVRDAIRATE